MKIIQKILILCVLVTIIQSRINLQLLDLNQYPGAQCLDGTAAGIYTQQGFGDGIDKYIIDFEGGGLCLGPTKELILMACYDRSQTQLGSSKNWKSSRLGTGTMSDNQTVNSLYYNWNKIYIPYCDGSCHQGYLEEPQKIFGKELYFRGYNITTQVINYIMNNFNIQNASQVILTGASAGGLGVYYWTNYLGDRLNPLTKFMSMPDSGYFINYPEQGLFMKCIQTFSALNNPKLYMPENCQYANIEGEQFKCLMPQYFAHTIKYPMLIIQSQYDLFQIVVALGVICEKGVSFQNCDSSAMEKVSDYRNTLVNLVNQTLQTPKLQYLKSGVWMPACAMHTWTIANILYKSQKYQVPMNSGHTLQETMKQWMESLNDDQSYRVRYMDNVTWPNNIPCSGLKNSSLEQLVTFLSNKYQESSEIDFFTFVNQEYMLRAYE